MKVSEKLVVLLVKSKTQFVFVASCFLCVCPEVFVNQYLKNCFLVVLDVFCGSYSHRYFN